MVFQGQFIRGAQDAMQIDIAMELHLHDLKLLDGQVLELALQLVGCALILVGIGVGQIQCGRDVRESPKT